MEKEIKQEIKQELYSVPEVAKILGRSQRSIRTFIYNGKIKSVLIGNKHSISRAEIDRIIENGIQ